MTTLKNTFKALGFLLLGGLVSHYLVEPFLKGNYGYQLDSVQSLFVGQGFEQANDGEKFKEIEQRVQRTIFKEFHREFGEDAFVKYEEYQRNKGGNGDDVFMFNYSKDELDNHSNQLNPNNDAYWESRGYDERPDDWENRDE